MNTNEKILFDAGLFIGALLQDDPRHTEARRVHDARHAAIAIKANISSVYTYDPDDWKIFEPEGLIITGPNSVCKELCRISS